MAMADRRQLIAWVRGRPILTITESAPMVKKPNEAGSDPASPIDRAAHRAAEHAAHDAALLAPGPDLHYLRRVAGSAGRWKRQLAEAKLTWPLATVDELVATDGHVRLLTELVGARYGLGHATAEAQVKAFFAARAS